jgi:mannose-6-phosphate isomerase-like protein (cupin superfamily)
MKYTKYTFKDRSGYIINSNIAHNLVAIGHTAFVTPWADPAIHIHENSEEYYLLLQGELRVLVAESRVTLRPQEMLMIKPQVPHAIVGGKGHIEHFGLRAPALKDKQIIDVIPRKLPAVVMENKRELQGDWGARIPLEASRNQNCWLIGAGSARFGSSYLTLAFLDFPTHEAANAGIETRHRLHVHQKSWEYYTVLKGAKILQIEDELIKIEAGEILEVPPQVCHTLHSRQAPYQGFTLRVPMNLNDKTECSVS